jgi:hypothetical protein
MTRNSQVIIALLIAILVIAGCSGGGKSPVNPGVDLNPAIEEDSETPLYISENLPQGETVPMIFGIYDVEIDPRNMTSSIVAERSASALGDSFHVDITPFLTVSPCGTCVDIKSVGLTEENDLLEVVFRTKHPFKPGARLDLHVFDLRGYIVNGENIYQFDGLKMDLDGDSSYESTVRGNVTLLKNPDGYSSFYDAIVEGVFGKVYDGNIYPYKCLWLDPGSVPPDTNYNPSAEGQYGFTDLNNPFGHNVFPMGGDFEDPLASTSYYLDLTTIEGTMYFSFVLEASYGATTRQFTRREPRYYLPEFHRKDPWMVQAGFTYNDMAGGADVGTALLNVVVMDWQAGVVPSGTWDYYSSNLTETRYASDIKSVTVCIPALLNSSLSADLNDLITGSGSFAEPYTWEFEISNEKLAEPGMYYGIVAVRDDLEGKPQAPYGVSSDVMNPVKLCDITTYQAFEVFLDDLNIDPIADLDLDKTQVYAYDTIKASVGIGCMDPDGTIIRYEYDFDYSGNPATFNPMYVQEAIDPNFGLPVAHFYEESDVGGHFVAQRVTDNLNGWDIDFMAITVLQNEPPLADIDVFPDPVRVCANVTASVGPTCGDPDGTIIKYEYDFYYTGVPATFNPQFTQNQGAADFGQPIVYQYPQGDEGNHLVAQRVTDNRSATDIDFDNIQVNANQPPNAVLQDNDADNIVNDDQTVTFQPGAGTNDPDGTLTKYEYDFAYNGSTFTADITQNQGSGFGNPVTYQFNNTGTTDITVAVAFRVTDDGCPNMTDLDVINFTVHPPVTTGLPIIEDFETTSPGAVPTNWGVTGRFGNAYYLNTLGSGCTNTTWRWGVTNNASQGSDSGSPSQTRFLNEDGQIHGTADLAYTYMNRATIVYTPEFTVPVGGATLTIRHWYDMTYVDNWLIGWFALDGGKPVLSIANPGSITWTDFCNQNFADHSPIRPLSVLSGPGYHSVSDTTSANHPLNGTSAHTHASFDINPSWRTNTYDISGSFAGQVVRVGFLFASDDIDLSAPNDCDPTSIGVADIFPKAGWRIQWMRIDAN